MRSMRAALSSLLLAAGILTAVGMTSPAHADECYTWNRTLTSGATGADVSELQIRVAGWAAYGTVLAVDGQYGPATQTAVRNFQSAYGLGVDGVAGSGTFNQIYALQDADCSPAHFDWSEVDGGCGQGGYSGGSVDATTVKRNLLRAMWQAEALRKRMGDQPLRVTSGFRSKSCDASVGGSGSGQHTYGTAIDLVPVGSTPSFCTIASNARSTGFGGIFGPGYPGHDDHTHVDTRAARAWSAPSCGI